MNKRKELIQHAQFMKQQHYAYNRITKVFQL